MKSCNILRGHDIVCFGPGDWWNMNPSCATRIMTRLSSANRIIYINPISSDLLGISAKSKLALKISRKLKSCLKYLKKANSNLYIFSPFFLPVQGNAVIDYMNNAFIWLQITALFFFLHIKNPLLWIENIRAADFIPFYKWKFIVYHASDLFDHCPYTRNKEKLRLRETAVSEKSDLIICVSKKLYENKQHRNSNAEYLPHGVDFDKFYKPSASANSFEQLMNRKHPFIGYFGTLTALNDIKLLEYCAAKLPQMTFVFAGRITAGDYTRLIALPNTVFLGKIPYSQIPVLCSLFDVCLLPWILNDWISHCNPLKLFEYMASGNPIVSIPIPEVADNYSDIISIAHNKYDFCAAIEWELKNDTTFRRRKRIAIARRNDWRNQIVRISKMIDICLNKGILYERQTANEEQSVSV